MKYRILIEQDEDGMFIAECPSLPGCVSQARTKIQVLKNIREAIELYLEPDPREIRPSKNHQVLTLAL